MTQAVYSSSLVANTDTDVVVVTVTQPLDASVDATGFTVKIDGGSDIVASALVVQGESTIALTLSTNIASTDSTDVVVAYAGGGDIVSATGGEALANITNQTVTNNVVAATFASTFVYNQEPTTIFINITEALDASTDDTGFAVSIDSGANVVSSVLVVQGATQIEVTTSVAVESTDTLTVAYAGSGDIVSAEGGEALAIFTAETVTNGVLADISDGNPALLTGSQAADGIDISYNSTGPYTTITNHQLQTPSILRTELQRAGLYLDGDRRGVWSKIKAARDAILVSLAA